MSTAKRKTTEKERFAALTREQKRARINSGRITFRNQRIHCSNCHFIVCNDCTIIGNNNVVRGRNNILYGENNRAEGTNNKCCPRSELPPTRTAPPNTMASAVVSLLEEMFDGDNDLVVDDDDDVPARPPAPSIDRAATQQLMPTAGVNPDANKWKACVLDLPGEPVDAPAAAMQCIVCMEKRFDTLFEPCHHLCCCRACARRLYKPDTPAQCPQCREKINFVSLVF